MSEDANKKEEYARNLMERAVREYDRIFIDTCSLLDPKVDIFWENLLPFLKKYNKFIVVPVRCIEELEKHAGNNAQPDLADRAKKAKERILEPENKDIIQVFGEETDNFADNVFLTVFIQKRIQYKLLLITQDNDLAKDIINSNKINSVNGKESAAMRINKYGFLSFFNWEEKTDRSDDKEKNIDPNEIFRICKTVTPIEDEVMQVSYIPEETDDVYTLQDESIRLIKEVAAGGEGIIYETNTPYVAKIYKKNKNTKRKFEKIKLMLTKPIDCEGVCYPVEALYNSNKEFVGYLMPKAEGKELQKSIFVKALLMKNFPQWKKRDTVELCITILEKIKYLHDRNIIMGDINPMNILVVTPKEVYFVDTDSYQIEEFPCPVGTINYTAPEIQRKSFNKFLRTMGNENFAVATLLFMIMLPGKPPYAHQGGEDPVSNIINMDFSYPFGENSNKKTPDGPWRYIWSHLTYDIKRDFYNTFIKGGAYSTEDTRLSVDEWLSVFKYYLELLDNGKFGKQDKMSEDLFPTRFKKNPNVPYITCKLCGNDVEERRSMNGICQDCLDKGETYKCKKCGKEITYTNYQKYIKNAKKYDTCLECFQKGNKVRMTLKCADCGKKFDITNNEYDYYKNKKLDIPKRCPNCRTARKQNDVNLSQKKYNLKTSNKSKTSNKFGLFKLIRWFFK